MNVLGINLISEEDIELEIGATWFSKEMIKRLEKILLRF